MLRVIPRADTLLPPPPRHQGPYAKRGICWHHMGAHERTPVTPQRAKRIQRINYDYQRKRWGAIDIIEGYDLILVGNEAWALEGRPWWSNCDAFSGAGRIGYPYIGVEVAGNYDANPPLDEMLQAMAELAARLHLEGKCGTDFSHGHRDFNYLSYIGSSDCPGKYLYPRLMEVQREAEKLISSGKKEEEKVVDFVRQISGEHGQGEFDGRLVDVWVAYGSGKEYLHARVNSEGATKAMLFVNVTYPKARSIGPKMIGLPGWGGAVLRLSEIAGMKDEEYGWVTIHLLPDDSAKFRGFIRP